MKFKIFVFASLLFSVQFSRAQQFKLLRYDEDYTALKDSTRTFYNRIKFLPLSQEGQHYLSFGGEMRGEFDRARHEDWGAMNTGSNTFVLQRYHLHADLHLGERFRIFGQLRSALENGRKNGPRPIDEDHLNVQNLFVDIIPWKAASSKLTLRLGRQEIQYGSGRLLDVREGPNLRLYFDGAKAAYSSPNFQVDGFVFGSGKVNPGTFDNALGRRARLWGVYSAYTPTPNFNVDLYYLGIDRTAARFDEGVADESRHTFGARVWKNGGEFLYNFELGYQVGSFGTDKIRAWGGSSEIGYRFTQLKGSPALKLRSDFISGDNKKDDGRLGTFNALHPNGGYFGMNPQAGPANLLSLHPNVSWSPCKKVLLSFATVFYWRQSLQDGIYRPDGSLSLSSSGSDKRYIGTSYISMATWTINKFLYYNFGVQYFETGDFINDVIPQHKDGFFVGSVLAFKF